MTAPLTPSQRAILDGLTDAQKQRLLDWPDHGSTFRGEPDEVALQLCEMGIGVIMPWIPKGTHLRCKQMGLTSGVGLAAHLAVREALTQADRA